MGKAYEAPVFEKFVQIRHRSLIFYSLLANKSTHRRATFNKPTYSGTVTSGSAKRIRKAVDLLLQVSKPAYVKNPATNKKFWHTLSFITLTIPESTIKPTAAEGHKNLLAPWILKMKRNKVLRTYIWKAEFQQNGMLHYHITTPSVINFTLIKQEWNNLLSEHGYLNDYWTRFPGKMPNSTDIHEVYKCNEIGHYLQKEIQKANQNEKTIGKVWDCSINLKSNKFYTIQEPSQTSIRVSPASITHLERCTIVNYPNPSSLLPLAEELKYRSWIDTLRVQISVEQES